MPDERPANPQDTPTPAPDFYARGRAAFADGLPCVPTVDPLLAMSPWDFTAYLGRMVDTGHTNVGQFEIWFASERDRLAAPAKAGA